MELFFKSAIVIPVLILSALVAFGVVYFQYQKDKDQLLTKNQRLILSALRFTAVFLTAILLSGVSIKLLKSKRISPKIILAVDSSKSMQPWISEVDSLVNQISSRYNKVDLHHWKLGGEATKTEEYSFDENESNYSEFLNKVSNNYLNQNLAGIILLGDGIFNKGSDPLFLSKSFPFPVHCIGIGDSMQKIDAAIKKVEHNPSCFLGNQFPVEIGIDFSMALGNLATISIEKDSKQIFSKQFQITSDRQFLYEIIRIKAEEPGINTYSLSITGLDNEVDLDNNIYEFSLTVHAQKQKILILGASAHPDISAINRALKSNQNYEIDIATGANNNIEFESYDLIVANQVPDGTPEFLEITKNIIDSKKPVLFIVGGQSSTQHFNQIQESVDLPSSIVFENAAASFNKQFSQFAIDQEIMEAFEELPPLTSLLGNVEFGTDQNVLFYQKVKGIRTGNPLIALGLTNKKRAGYILGEGIWRWRIYDYLQNGNHDHFDKLIQKTVNFLIIKPNEDIFNIYTSEIYDENDPVRIQAELFNASNELINEPDVEIKIYSNDSTEYAYFFSKNKSGYSLNAGKLPVGTYTFQANTKMGEETLSKNGFFRIAPSQNELMNQQANFQLMSQLSRNTGGKFITPENLEDLYKNIEASGFLKKQKVQQVSFLSLIDIRLLLAMIVALLSVEWFLRKYLGTY